MAFAITLNGNKSVLNATYFPPIELNRKYECGLIDLQTYHSVPNVDIQNQNFHINDEIIVIPIGSYEVDDIAAYIKRELKKISKTLAENFELKANNNTLKCEIKSNGTIYFNRGNTIGKLLGFSATVLKPNILNISDLPVNIIKINTIRVDCNIIEGSYFNDKAMHILHEFSLNVPPGYKINEVPRNVIYLPVTADQIRSITIKFLDQDGDLINFREENITVRLHLKPC